MTSVIAHRGASAAAPENTVAAFRLANQFGADAVELDARRTADGALVVAHDPQLADGRIIVEQARAELPGSLPTLAEALDACVPMLVNIEIKNLPGEPDFDEDEYVAGQVVAEIQRRSAHGRVLVSSFNLATIDRVLALDPGIPTAYLVFHAESPEALVEKTVAHGHGTLHPWDGMVTTELVAVARSAGLGVNVWTVDAPDRMAELIGFGVNGICTNVPDVARRVVDGS